jgi:putative glycosyltransferase (TIGR04348 family)
MRITIITPAPPGSQKGNRVTALRWATLLRQLGHHVRLEQTWRDPRCDVLIALHARKSFESMDHCRRARPQVPIILALTGTDVYDDIDHSAEARRALEFASRIVVLQPLAIRRLPLALQGKARVIYQSCAFSLRRPKPRAGAFEVCVLGHLRPVKDPLRAALAARRLPASSRVRILQLGASLSPELEETLRKELETNPRLRWLGEVPRSRAFQILARCRLLVLSSLLEGGANVISEAIVAGTPVLASRIDGSIGLLGDDYPGYFPMRDTEALARLLQRAETDPVFYRQLTAACRRLRPRFRPTRERAAWRSLLGELKRSNQ